MAATPSHVEPIGIPISDLHRHGGPSRAVAFGLLAAGKLEGYRVGRARMILYSSVKRFIAEAAGTERAARLSQAPAPEVGS